MANKRDLKKYFQNHLNFFAEQAYVRFLNGDTKQKENADALLDKAADLLEDFSNKVGNYPKQNPTATKKHFSDLKMDFEAELDKLFESMGEKRLA